MANNFDPTVNWTDDELSATDKLNAMVQNDNTLYNLTPHFLYRRGAGRTVDFNDSQSRVLKPTIFAVNGLWNVTNKYARTSFIPFPPGTFAPACKPVVVVQIAGINTSSYAVWTIAGGDGTLDVKSEGFRLTVRHRDGARFKNNIYVHALAWGWQEA